MIFGGPADEFFNQFATPRHAGKASRAAVRAKRFAAKKLFFTVPSRPKRESLKNEAEYPNYAVLCKGGGKFTVQE